MSFGLHRKHYSRKFPPPKAELNTVKLPAPGIEAFDVQVDCLGKPVSGYYGRPKDAKPKSLPAILFVHGAGVPREFGKHALVVKRRGNAGVRYQCPWASEWQTCGILRNSVAGN